MSVRKNPFEIGLRRNFYSDWRGKLGRNGK